MSCSGSTLILNEEALQTMEDSKRPVFIYEWLRRLEKNLPTVNRQDVKEAQKTLVAQLMSEVTGGSPGPPTRQLLAQCMATLFSVGDTFLLFDTINKCNDILKIKDDSPTVLPSRLAATVVVGTMYERLGRMMGRSYEETVSVLTKSLKSAESTARAETMRTLGRFLIVTAISDLIVHWSSHHPIIRFVPALLINQFIMIEWSFYNSGLIPTISLISTIEVGLTPSSITDCTSFNLFSCREGVSGSGRSCQQCSQGYLQSMPDLSHRQSHASQDCHRGLPAGHDGVRSVPAHQRAGEHGQSVFQVELFVARTVF